MTTLQEYLNQKYPSQEDKEKVEVINTYRDISNSKRNKLKEGNLDLSEYPNLTKLEIDGSELSEKLTNLNLGPKPKLREFYCPNNHLSNLDLTNCPVLEKLDCSNNQLTELDISQLKKLTTLDCGSNQLRELDALKCPNLKVFKCSNNFLNNLDLNKNGKLEILDISDNDFTEQDLKRIQEEVYNRFAGSLEPLKNMAKLKNIRFSNTDLSEGLEYLTNNLERLECSANERENAKTKILAQKLTKFGEPNNLGNFVHLLRIWKEFNECKRKNDRLNKGKTREEITNLDL
ncbi:12354_t:CDS:2, partial [Funneliformis geosporum]